MALFPRSFALALTFAMVCCAAAPAAAQDARQGSAPAFPKADESIEQVFAAVPFDLWVKQGPVKALPWKVHIEQYGLSLQQRMRAHVDIELRRRDLANHRPEDRIVSLIQVTDAAGHEFRDYELFRMKDVGPEIRKGELEVFWDMYVLPGEYQVTVALVDAARGTHNLTQKHLRVEAPKNDPLPELWQGLPAVEFLSPYMEGPDAIFRPDVTTRLHLPLATKRPVKMEVLADVTASDLFQGSTVFYNHYLEVALPLLKALSQVDLEQGSLDVAMLDLRRRRVTFEQDDVRELDWPRARGVLAPENGPATIDIKALEQKRESPEFLQDELVRRLNTPVEGPRGSDPLHVFVIIGSPMDFYSFRDLPQMPPGSEEKCVVYYLQFELLNTTYADGAVGNVRKMLKPLTVHVFKVRTAESIRHALARMLSEIEQM